MVNYENRLGTITITREYFTNLVGHLVTGCFGVSQMAEFGAHRSILSKFIKSERLNKGIKVQNDNGKLYIDVCIKVTYGLNISEIVKSIVHKVKYGVENATGLEVVNVSVHVAEIISE